MNIVSSSSSRRLASRVSLARYVYTNPVVAQIRNNKGGGNVVDSTSVLGMGYAKMVGEGDQQYGV